MKPDTTVNLGSFQFALFEIPEKIHWGGSQRTAVHELVGGQRIIDAMGRSDRALEWSGLMFGGGKDKDGNVTGDSATTRARFLDAMRAAGKPQVLAFGEFKYLVIVKEFDADYERLYQIPYRISCEVIADQANPVTAVLFATIDSSLRIDYNAAVSLATPIGDVSLTSLLATVGAAISTAGSLVNAGRSIIASVSQPLASVQARVQVLLGTSDAVLGGVTAFGGVMPGLSAGISAASLVAQLSNMGQYNSLSQLGSTVSRMSANLGAIQTSPNTVTTAGGNLFSLASWKYGDATAWTGIAKANNLTDPFVQGIQTLNIPASPDTAGGILNS